MSRARLTSNENASSRIAKLRDDAGLTQQELAVLVGVTVSTIQNWERSKSGVDQILKFLKLCIVLGCELQDLIDYSVEESSVKKGFSLQELRDLRKKWVGETEPPNK